MTPDDLKRLLPEAIALARAGGAAILRIYNGKFEVRHKEDYSPLTDADEASEEAILAGLAQLTPDIAILSEEAASRDGLPKTAPPRFWLVDPLDGTREFVKRNGEFSVNIGLIVDRRPVLGVLLAPVTGVLWASCGPGTATMRVHDEAPKPIFVRKPPPQGMTVLASRSHGDTGALDAFLSDYKVAELRNRGSSQKLGVVAEGSADLYPRFGPTMEWDTAAGHAILNAAGGRIETAAGGELLYGKPTFKNPDFIAFGAT